MKKITAALLTLFLLFALCIPAFAADYTYIVDPQTVLADPGPLNDRAQALYDQYGVSFCYLNSNVEDGAAATASVEALFVPGETIPDAPAIVLVDGETSLFVRGVKDPGSRFRDGVTDAIFEAYENEQYTTDGVLAFFDAAASYVIPQTDAPKADVPQSHTVRMIDNAGLLDAADAAALNERLNEISLRQACDVVILTVDGLEGKTPTAYADDYFDYNGYGLGENRDGILFLISMEDRDWAISTRGYGITAFTDYGQEQIMSAIKSDLSGGYYGDAFNGFADKCDELLTLAHNGTPLDVEDDGGQFRKLLLGPAGIIAALVLGFLIAGIPMKKLKAQINNVKWQKNAADYTRPGSMMLTQQYDNFLYANTTRTVIETESSGGSRGGSSTHTSSSGATHGGSSGKF